MLASSIIAKKRDHEKLSREEIEFILNGFVDGTVPDYQMSALAMAILCRGMDSEEIANLTYCMWKSGISLNRSTDRPRVDKHSTGGLGDKTSLILAPLLACFDLDVPMLSGRGLGITGGTLDKLEAIEGFRCDLNQSEIDRQLRSIGCVITGTTPDITPADRKLYALRDVTGTVPSVALITASILSKKLAESLDALVLDVKFGTGAFMQTYDAAQALSDSLVRTGQQMRQKTFSIMSDMNQPLGRMVGNGCEVNESLDVLRGSGPVPVRELTLQLSAPLMVATGRAETEPQAMVMLSKKLDSGEPLDRFQKMVEYQSGKFVDAIPLATASVLKCPRTGTIENLHGQLIGQAVIELGGGRSKLGDPIDHSVGMEFLVRLGDKVNEGQPWVRIFCNAGRGLAEATALLNRGLTIQGD
jgi:pyrimidine-nucleoside phosphorylase